MTLPPDAAPTQGLARCYRHPMRETGVRCIRCNRPICPDCMRPASVGFHCPDDVNLAARSIRVPRTVAGAKVTSSQQAWVTYAIIAANVAVYLATAIGQHGGFNSPESSSLFQNWSLVPYLVARGDTAQGHEYTRLITSAFLHVSVLHIAMNMLALGFIGPFVERAMGWWRYLCTYLLAALGGSVAVYLFGERLVPVAGASGAIYGLFAAALILARRLSLDTRALVITIVINFIFTFSIPQISIEGHIGGFVVGGLVSLAIVGWPHRATRIPVRVQAAALAGMTLLLIVLVAVRTADYPVPGAG